ncbi:MAG: hypothetical protein VX528_07515, partial [Candidatus Latescibacterota bacterium]|nr:hypothetical protein [Candidatus Latescibacterota bacterium]
PRTHDPTTGTERMGEARRVVVSGAHVGEGRGRSLALRGSVRVWSWRGGEGGIGWGMWNWSV